LDGEIFPGTDALLQDQIFGSSELSDKMNKAVLVILNGCKDSRAEFHHRPRANQDTRPGRIRAIKAYFLIPG